MDAVTARRLSWVAAVLLVAAFLLERLLTYGWADLGCVAMAAIFAVDWLALRRRTRLELVYRYGAHGPIWNRPFATRAGGREGFRVLPDATPAAPEGSDRPARVRPPEPRVGAPPG